MFNKQRRANYSSKFRKVRKFYFKFFCQTALNFKIFRKAIEDREKLAKDEFLKFENQIAFLEKEKQDNLNQKTAEFSSLISQKKELETKL